MIIINNYKHIFIYIKILYINILRNIFYIFQILISEFKINKQKFIFQIINNLILYKKHTLLKSI